MKRILLLLLASAMVFSASSAQPLELEAVFHYPPGAGTDTATSSFWAAMDKTNKVKVKKVYYKSCAEAIEHVVKNPNSLLASFNTAINLEGETSICPSAPKNNITVVTTIISSSAYLCTAPGRPELTLDDLKSNKVYRVAAVTSKATSGATQVFLKAINSPSKVIPYANSAEFRAGAASGDVDFVFGANGIPELVTAGSKCLAASSVNNLKKLPSLALITDGVIPEYLFTMAVYTAHPNTTLNEIIAIAVKDPAFIENVANRQGIHLGVGSGNTIAQQKELLIKDYNAVDNF
jgi:hypothetical protein